MARVSAAETRATVGLGAGFIGDDYANMTNIIFYMHAYYSGTSAGALALIEGSVASNSGYLAAQTVTSADGIVPVIFNEYGSGNSNPNQGDGAAIVSAIQAVAANGVGGGGFLYYNPNGADDYSMVNNGGSTSWSVADDVGVYGRQHDGRRRGNAGSINVWRTLT